MMQHLAAHRDMASQRKDKSAKRIDFIALVTFQRDTNMRFQFFHFQTGIGHRYIFIDDFKLRGVGIIMFIFYFADNFLDQIFDSNQAVHPAKFIYHQCQMLALQAHFL